MMTSIATVCNGNFSTHSFGLRHLGEGVSGSFIQDFAAQARVSGEEAPSGSLSKWLSEMQPVRLKNSGERSGLQGWATSIYSAMASFSNYLSNLNLLPLAEAVDVRPKLRVATDDCDFDHTLNQNSQCHVMVKRADGWTTRYPADYPGLAGVFGEARKQLDQLSPYLRSGTMFLLEDLQYGPAQKGVILDTNLDCLDFATIDYFTNHNVANEYLLSVAADIARGERVSRGYLLPLQNRKELDYVDLKNGDIALLVDNSSGRGGVPVHVGRVVVNPNDSSIWIADKAGSGGYHLSALENWLFDNPIYRNQYDVCYIITPPGFVGQPESLPLQQYLVSTVGKLTSSIPDNNIC